MKNNFEPGECALCTTEDEYNALRDVIASDGWPVSKFHHGYYKPAYYGVGNDASKNEFVTANSDAECYRRITLQEALFRGAPDFATLLVKASADYFVWLDCNTALEYVRGMRVDSGIAFQASPGHEWDTKKVIARREPQKTPAQKLAEIFSEWPDCHGEAGLLAKSHPELKIVTKWCGEQWQTATINGVTKEEWLDAVTLRNQDMIKLAGRDVKAQMVSDIKDAWHKSFAIEAIAEALINKGWVKK